MSILYEPTPSVHINPTWIDENTIAFESKGAKSVGPGWLSIVPENRGVVGYNLSSGEYEMLIPEGLSPNANYLGNVVAGFQGNNTSPISVWTPQGLVSIGDTEEWQRRSKVCVNHDGTKLGWRNISLGHDIGVWIYSLPTLEYLFVGTPDSDDEGSSNDSSNPVWHPVEDILLYSGTWVRGSGDSTIVISSIIEFHFSSGESDTLATLDMGIRSMCYSPTGNQVALIGAGPNERNHAIFVLDVTSGTYSKIKDHFGRGLSWGERGLVYNNDCGELDDPGCGVLWLLDPSTGESSPITQRFQFNFVDQGLLGF